MNEWNENEKFQQQYDQNQRFNSRKNDNERSYRYTNSNSNGNNQGHNKSRNQNNRGNSGAKQTNQLLQEIVKQNDKMIYLLKGIKYALQNDGNRMNNKKNKGKVPQQNKPYIQRFDKGADKEETDTAVVDTLTDVVEAQVEASQEIVEEAQQQADIYENENEIGEENPFAMFEETEIEE